jgi:hypothetical protein
MSVAKDLLFEQMEQESREQTPEELFEDALTRPEPTALRTVRAQAYEACAQLCERYARRHTDIRKAALEVCAENIRAELKALE